MIRFIEYAHRAAVNVKKIYSDHCQDSAGEFIAKMVEEAKKIDVAQSKDIREPLLRDYIKRVNESFVKNSLER